MRLAGTYHPIEYLLIRSEELFPGLASVSAVWKTHNQSLIYSEKNGLSNHETAHLQKLRAKKWVSFWSESDDLLVDTISNKQATFYDEQNLRTLILSFENQFDGLHDLLILSFPENYSLQKLDVHFKGITASEKSMLANMIQSFLSAEYQRVVSEQKLIRLFEANNTQNQSNIQKLKERLKFTEELFSQSLHFYVNEIAKTLESELNCRFVFSKEALKHIAQSSVSLEDIKSAVENAIYAAFHLYSSKVTIEIPTSLLIFETKSNEYVKANTSVKNKDKTIELLDRYEEAAQQCQQLNLVVNGKNIAGQLDPPISPPAISDAIKKHKKRIAILFADFPTRWQFIRSSLRPLTQLDQSNERAIAS